MSMPSSDRAAIRQVIRALVKSGHALMSVNDGDDDDVMTETETDAIDAITAVDDATLYVTVPGGEIGWVRFVLGNDPEEVVCDHTVDLSPTIDALMATWE